MQTMYDDRAFQALPNLTPEEESQYLQDYLPLVRKVLRQLAPQCTCVMERQDMEQVALLGLLYAIRRYGAPDEKFGGYAIRRVRGAILDELRRLDWRPRTLRQHHYHINDKVRDLRRVLGYEPSRQEIVAAGIAVDDYDTYLQLENASVLASLDDMLAGDQNDAALQERGVEERYVTQQILSKALSQLSPNERTVLALYYQHDMNLHEIALVLKVTESRVCQINKKIVEKIREYVGCDY